MQLEKLWLRNFRNYDEIDVLFPPSGLVLVQGKNGQGKTNLLEAIRWLSTLSSFRTTTPDVMVQSDADKAVVRGEGLRRGRRLLIESEISRVGRNRTLVNRQSLRKTSELSELLLTTVFAPDDLELVKGGPTSRRRYLDEVGAAADSRVGDRQRELDRVLRQRNALLRQARGRLTAEIGATLDVWDERLVTVGEGVGTDRSGLISRLQPFVEGAYGALAGAVNNGPVVMTSSAAWRVENGGPGLRNALVAARNEDVARGVTTGGPHRDDLQLAINDLPARTHASQGEQRTLSLALRLAGHKLLRDVAGAPPILLLDDVFSELDDGRSRRLLESLPEGQTFLTTAVGAPLGIEPSLTLHVEQGRIT